MQLAATIAVVLSVLVLAAQARELARQSRLVNEVAGTRTHGEIVLHWKRVMDVFIRHPELHAYYFDQTRDTPSAPTRSGSECRGAARRLARGAPRYH